MLIPPTDPNTAYSPNLVDGFFGFTPQGRNVVADTEGFFGFAAGKSTNVVFNVIAPARSGNLVRNGALTLTVQYGTTTEVIPYDAAYVYERTLDLNTDISFSTNGGLYIATTQTFRIPDNSLKVVTVRLQFTSAFACYVRRKYL